MIIQQDIVLFLIKKKLPEIWYDGSGLKIPGLHNHGQWSNSYLGDDEKFFSGHFARCNPFV